jgi:hypothetical protein
MSLLMTALLLGAFAGQFSSLAPAIQPSAADPAGSNLAGSGMGSPDEEAGMGSASLHCLSISRSSRLDPPTFDGARSAEDLGAANAETRALASCGNSLPTVSWIGRDHFRRGPPAPISA